LTQNLAPSIGLPPAGTGVEGVESGGAVGSVPPPLPPRTDGSGEVVFSEQAARIARVAASSARELPSFVKAMQFLSCCACSADDWIGRECERCDSAQGEIVVTGIARQNPEGRRAENWRYVERNPREARLA
jgi:hypothetical protein